MIIALTAQAVYSDGTTKVFNDSMVEANHPTEHRNQREQLVDVLMGSAGHYERHIDQEYHPDHKRVVGLTITISHGD